MAKNGMKVVGLEGLSVLKQKLEGEQAPSALDGTLVTGVQVGSEEINLDDELGIQGILASIMHARVKLQEAGSVDDEELKTAVARKENARVQLPQLYEARVDLEARLKDMRSQVKIATQHKLTDKVTLLSSQIGEAERALTHASRLIKAIEDRYPDMAAEFTVSHDRMSFVRSALARFAQNEAGQYTASGTVNPAPATIAEATTFLTGLIEKISTGERAFMRTRQDGETALVVTAKGSWVSMYPEILEINELGVALIRYRMAIETAERQKLEQWAAGLVEARYLLSPKMVQAMKEKGAEGLRRNLLDLVDAGSGYFFMPVNNNDRCVVGSYAEVRRPEVLVRIIVPEEVRTAAYVIQFNRVTAPQVVDGVFGKEGSRHYVTVRFNTVAELLDPEGLVGKRIPENLRKALVSAYNFAQRQRQEQADLAEIRNVRKVELLRTVEEISTGRAGTAVISVSEYSEEGESYRTYPLAMRVVSDGNVTRPGLATSRSKEGWLYKALKDDVKVTEFFARAKDGTFSNVKLQDVAVRNEEFEVDWLVARAAVTHNAELISAKNGNVGALCLMVADGGRDGTFVITVPVHDRKPGSKDRHQSRDKGRKAAYVVTRSGDTITFVTGLTGYSRTKLETSGCKFNEPYAIEFLADYPRYVLRTLFCAVTGVTDRDKAPLHLLRTKPVAAVTVVPSEVTPAPQVDESVEEPYGDVLDVADRDYIEDDPADETEV